MKNIHKYLSHYADPCIKALDGFPNDIFFVNSVVIPAYKESSTFVSGYLNSSLAQQNTLMVLVINQPDTDTNKYPQQTLHQDVCAMGKIIWANESFTLVKSDKGNSSVLLLDSFTQPIPEKQGVGTARKQGVDTVLALIADNKIKSDWICSTDADASLPESYFDSLAEMRSDIYPKIVGACFNFYHESPDLKVHQANALYEQALRYYVAGLTYAKSSYNFFTIGSILSFKAKAYAEVRGFPQRSAGEDFYLLNKLAKLGDIIFLKDHIIKLTARCSDRVPFGTGPAVNQIISLQAQEKEYCYYHPQVFILLKEVLCAFTTLFDYCSTIEDWLVLLSKEAREGLLSLGFESYIKKQNAQQQKLSNKKQFYKQLYIWFDAFKTLKFIHFAKNNYWPDIPLERAINSAPFELLTEVTKHSDSLNNDS
ncbi:glycosyltransferase [Thalassotalea profundi]|uniref:Glycosyltransferase n=1 Tax=Thalassotalea profundi TaxID=2036687 RepID=A0ABQ3IU50_9GAMM|nr:hypothetical protein [Thalassotalea profundi]GHE91071.1 hypothetical protein GCM10011501_20640 [Thalassotalea profundi]